MAVFGVAESVISVVTSRSWPMVEGKDAVLLVVLSEILLRVCWGSSAMSFWIFLCCYASPHWRLGMDSRWEVMIVLRAVQTVVGSPASLYKVVVVCGQV